MKLKMGLVVGFAAGIYLGAKAGKDRLGRVESLVRRAGGSTAGAQAVSKLKAAADLGLERLRDLIETQRS
ncbi:MAG: hypothetical protein ACYCS7_01355 [Acidimicrobiales bacterium]